MVDQLRTASSVTASTDGSPKCVTWNWADAPDPEGVDVCVEDIPMHADSELDPPTIERNLLSSFTMVSESSQVHHEASLDCATNQEQRSSFTYEIQEVKSVKLCEGDGDNHEVELEDVVGLFRGDEGHKQEEEEEEVPEPESSRGMKKFMSRVSLNPKLKNFMSSLTIEKDVKVSESVCGESVEVSLLKELGQSKRSVTSHEYKLAITKGDGSFADRLEVVDEAVVDGAEVRKAKVCTADKTEEDNSNEDTSANTKPVYSKSDVSEFGSGERAKGMKKLLSRVKLNPKLKSYISAKVPESNHEDDVETSLHDKQQKSKCVNDDEFTAVLTEVVARAGDLEILKNNAQPSDESTEDTFAITKEDGSDADRLAEVLEAEVANTDMTKEDGANEHKSCKSAVSESGSGGKEGARGMKKLMSRVKLNPKLRNFMTTKVFESNHEETAQVSQCANSIGSIEDKSEIAKEDVSICGRLEVVDELEVIEANGDDATIVESGCGEVIFQQSKQCIEDLQNKMKTVSDDDDDDDGEIDIFEDDVSTVDELDKLIEDASRISKARSSKAGSSCIGMSVFGGTSKGSGSVSAIEEERAAEEERAVEEQRENPYEFRQMEVTLKVKALAGVSQDTSRRELNPQNGDGIDDTVKAVVTYRRNTIASDRFVSTHVPSLPIFRENIPGLADAQVYAQWPGGQKDDDTNASVAMSSVTLTRTVRRVRNFDNVSSGATVGGSQVKEPKEKDSKRFLASLSKAFAPELLDLQVGLMRGSGEIIPLGIATVVIPGEYKRMELDIPVVRNYYTGENALSKSKVSQLRGKTRKDHVFFSDDKDTKYKINEGAFLRLELNIEPAVTSPAASFAPRHLNTNTRKADFRSGPINRAIRRRRKMDHLLGLKKLPLHKRIQLYLELRSRKGSNSSKSSPYPNSKEIYISRQTEVSEVSWDIQPSSIKEASEADDASESLIMNQYDSRSLKIRNSLLVSKAVSDADNQDERLSLASQHSTTLSFQPKGAPLSSASVTAAGTNRHDASLSLASENSGASANPVSIASYLAKEKDGRLSPASQDSDQDDNLTHFSSSLYSVFTTNHPQKQTAAQNMMDLLCEPNDLILCDEERNALKYYAHDQEEKIVQYFAPFLQDEFSVQDTNYEDEDTLASLGSLSVIGNRRK